MRSVRCMVLLGAASASAAFTSEVNCITAVDPEPTEPVETVTVPSTSTVSLSDATSTVLITSTVTAAPVTKTETSSTQVIVTETDNTITDTFTSTSTATETSTETTTETSTSTSTETTTTTTTTSSTVSTPSGFFPVSDTANGYPSRKKRDVRHPRDCHHRPTTSSYSALSLTSTSSQPGGTYIGSYSQYPQSVQCSVTTTTQQTVTVTNGASTTSTITPPQVTETTTETSTSTSTEVPRAQTTETVIETTTGSTTVTETATSITTTTETAEATATALTYAACSAANILGPRYEGNYISDALRTNGFSLAASSQYTGDVRLFITLTSSAKDCCVNCVTTPGCRSSASSFSQCYLLLSADGSCPASQGAHPAGFTTRTGGGNGFTISNGLCGYQKLENGS